MRMLLKAALGAETQRFHPLFAVSSNTYPSYKESLVYVCFAKENDACFKGSKVWKAKAASSHGEMISRQPALTWHTENSFPHSQETI